MKLRDQILKEHSKINNERIVKWVGSSQERFDELFNLFLHDGPVVVQRAAWTVSCCAMDHPSLIKKHFGKLLKNLAKPNLHGSVKRNSIRLMQDIQIPKRHEGAVMDLCFRYISTPGEEVAVKAFSLTVLSNLSKHYPDIIPEIKLLIEENYERETAAFKVRAKHFLKKY
jgi:hypothetical protein